MFEFAVVGQILWTSLATTSYLVLFAVAFALVLKVNGIFNFTQAAVMTVAFYAAYGCVQLLNLPGWVAFLVSMIATLAVSWLIETFGFAALRRKRASNLFVFIFTFIVSQFVAYLASLLFGTWSYTIYPSMFWDVTPFGEIVVSAWDLPAMGAALSAIIALFLFLRFSRPGQFMMAVADNRELAQFYGIEARKILLLSLLIAGALAALGMFLFGTRTLVQPRTTMELMLFAAVASIIGGIGNLGGAAIAAICLGLIQNTSILFIPSAWQSFLLYAFLFITIIFFPRGFHWPERVRVQGLATRQLPQRTSNTPAAVQEKE